MDTLSVRGYVEALANLRAILGIRKHLRARLLTEPPRLFIGIDAPDFNLSLETDLRAAGIPTVHFISPSIWAWRPERIEKIRHAVDHMLLVFPFEEAIYRAAGIPATYVGHPLAQALPAAPDRLVARARLGLAADAVRVALMPGSRDSEIKALVPLFTRVAQRLKARYPKLAFLVPMLKPEHRRRFETCLAELGLNPTDFDIRQGQAHDIMQAADVALIASGTATLEALLLDCPHVITYRVPKLTFWLMKRRACTDMVGLPNILAGRRIVPELIQEQATPEQLAAALSTLLDNPEKMAAMRAEFAPLRAALRRDTPSAIGNALEPFLR
jgi:lipid-A-disaccharide synthase